MCFSATASFSAAAVTGVIGVVAVRHVRNLPEVPLAIVPLLFACQQAIEGVLWLQLPADIDTGTVRVLSLGFLMFALVLWPTYAAVAVLFVEPDRRRRRLLSIIAGLGFLLSAHLLWGLLNDSPDVSVQGHSIRYATDVAALSWKMIPYLLCTCIPLLLSSHRLVQAFGAVVLVGYLVSGYLYFESFISVWCFFAAADSTLLYFYFRRAALEQILLSWKL